MDLEEIMPTTHSTVAFMKTMKGNPIPADATQAAFVQVSCFQSLATFRKLFPVA